MLVEVVLTHNVFDGSHPGAHASPLVEPPVLTRTHQVLTSAVLRVLVEDPVSTDHVARVDISGLEMFIQGGNVLSQLHHLPPELGSLIQHHFVSNFALRGKKKDFTLAPVKIRK